MLSNDENGEAKPFESPGMFEIRATANGEEINIAKDKKINVNLASKVEGEFDFPIRTLRVIPTSCLGY